MRFAIAVLLVVLFACERPDVPRNAPESAPTSDRRPDVGEPEVVDLTEVARLQNLVEPPLPTRRGTLKRTSVRPVVARTDTGFVARIPGSSRIETPAYYQNRVYAGASGTYEFHALDATSGKSEFSVKLSDDGPTAPACQDEVCVFNTYSCTLFAVNARTGEYLWSWWLGSPQLATAVIAGDMVLSSYPDHSGPAEATYVLAAFDLKSGKPLWRRWIDGEVNSTPVSHDGHVYAATVMGKLYKLTASEGDIVLVMDNKVASAPVIAGDGVFFSRADRAPDNDMLGTIELIVPALEVPRLVQKQLLAPKPRPLITGDRLIRVESGLLVATNRDSGRELWTRALGDDEVAAMSAPLLFAGGSVLVATTSGKVVRMNPESGEVTQRFALGHGAFSSPPIVSRGWIYVGTTAGTLVGYDTGDRDLTGWSMLGGGPDRRGTASEEGS